MRVTSIVSLILAFHFSAQAGKIKLRKVKEDPKVCTVMSEDKLLSKSNKRIYGTLRNSMIFDDNISMVNDLGKKVCQWSYDKWLPLGDLTKYTYYIDEQRNKLYSYTKIENQYRMVKVDLENCELGEPQTTAQLDLPKCEKQKKSKNKSRAHRKVASH